MEIRMLSVTSRPPAWVAAAVESYLRRLVHLKVSLVDIRPDKSKDPAEAVRREGELIRRRLTDRENLVVLDEKGDMPDTRRFADAIMSSDRPVTTFVIGGANGIDQSVIRMAASRLSLSRLTLPHALAKVVMAEQLYRVDSLIRGHPYHREGTVQ